MAGPLPYVSLPYDNRAHTGRMSDLIGHQGQINASLALQRGQAIGNMVSGIGEGVAAGFKTYTDVSKQQKIEQEKQRFRQVSEMVEGARDAQGKPLSDDAKVAAMRSAGYGKEANELAETLWKTAAAKQQYKLGEITLVEKTLGQVRDQVGAIKKLPTPEERAAAYTAALPKFREMVGERLAPLFPDQYSDDLIPRLETVGLSFEESLNRQRLTEEARDRALKSTRDKNEYNQKMLGYYGKDLANARNQGDWDMAIAGAAEDGIEDDLLRKYGQQFSPEARDHAKRLISTESTAAGAQEFERLKRAYNISMKRAPDAPLSYQEELKIKKDVSEAERKPDSDGGIGGLTPAGHQTALANYRSSIGGYVADYQRATKDLDPEDEDDAKQIKSALDTYSMLTDLAAQTYTLGTGRAAPAAPDLGGRKKQAPVPPPVPFARGHGGPPPAAPPPAARGSMGDLATSHPTGTPNPALMPGRGIAPPPTQPPTPSTPPPTQGGGGMVQVKTPDGQVYNVTPQQLKELERMLGVKFQ